MYVKVTSVGNKLPQELAADLVAPIIKRGKTNVLDDYNSGFPRLRPVSPALTFVDHVEDVLKERSGSRDLRKRNCSRKGLV